MAMTKETVSVVPTFDTRRYVRNLMRDGGFSEKQADAHADGLQESLAGVAKVSDTVALKTDIVALKVDIESLKSYVLALESKTDVRFEALQEQMRGLRQMMAIGFSVNGGLILLATLILGLQ